MGGGEILKKGWLIKSPPLDGSSIKSWRRRWFCLRTSKVLEYYKSEDGDLKGVINLEDCRSVNSDLFHRKYKHVFDVETKDRTYYLVANSREEMMDWVDIICKMCNFMSEVEAKEESGRTYATPIRNTKTLPQKLSQTENPYGQAPKGIPFIERFKPVENGGPPESFYSLAAAAGEEVQRQLNREQEVPAGVPLSEALASKRIGSVQRTSSSSSSRASGTSLGGASGGDAVSNRYSGSEISNCYFSPRILDDQGYLGSVLDPHVTYDSPSNNTPFSTVAPPGRYDKLRSTTVLAAPGEENFPPHQLGQRSFTNAPALRGRSPSRGGAEILSNGYMKPRPSPDRVPHYDYPPIGPPRPIDGDTSPRMHRSALLKSSSPPTPPDRSDTPPDDPHTYIDMQAFVGGDVPPLIDRSTKPVTHPPKVDRTLKPSHKKDRSESESPSHSGESPVRSESLSSTVSEDFEGSFVSSDIPRKTGRSTCYTQVEINAATRRPIPLPRRNSSQAASNIARAKITRVNYSDIDLEATKDLAERKRRNKMTLREAERAALSEKYYVNVDREGQVDEDTNPEYYTYMRDFTFQAADKPPHFFYQERPDSDDDNEEHGDSCVKVEVPQEM